jgi:hypothetical protein
LRSASARSAPPFPSPHTSRALISQVTCQTIKNILSVIEAERSPFLQYLSFGHCSVDRHRCNADLDADPDPTFYYDAGPDPDPSSSSFIIAHRPSKHFSHYDRDPIMDLSSELDRVHVRIFTHFKDFKSNRPDLVE